MAELRDVVEANDDARRFNVVNVATAFSRLGRHLSDDQRGTLDGQAWYLALETRTLALLPELSGWAASSVTWSLARAERDPGSAFWEALERTLIARASELEPQGVANVWAFAVMGRRAPPALRNALEAAAASFCGGPEVPRTKRITGSRTSTFSIRDDHGVLGADRFGEAPSSDVLERFERRLPYVMARLKPKELANVASAYGRVGGGGGVLPKLAALRVEPDSYRGSRRRFATPCGASRSGARATHLDESLRAVPRVSFAKRSAFRRPEDVRSRCGRWRRCTETDAPALDALRADASSASANASRAKTVDEKPSL